MKITSLLCAGLFSFLISNNALAQEPEAVIPFDIPVLADAQVFANYQEQFPLMLNYFTHSEFTQIEGFYNEHFGGPLSAQTRYGRLELIYEYMETNIRVIVAHQNNKREVDIIIEQSK